MARKGIDQADTPEGRAEALSGALVVRQNTAGEPIWFGAWRDSSRRRMLRRLGPAWLRPAKNPFSDDDEPQKNRGASWEATWIPARPKTPPAGSYTRDG